MAQICEKCGKKVGMFSDDPLKLTEERIICHSCAEPIHADMENLHYVKTLDEFNSLKNEILIRSHELYEESIIKAINEKIERIQKRRTFSTEEERAEIKRTIISNHMLTTGYDFTGHTIKKYIGVISGQVVLGTGFLSEFTASFSDFFGTESDKFADKLETAKNAAIEKLIIKSNEKGGNAIIGVDFDYISFHGNMIGVVANGTSVVIEEIKNGN